MLLPFLIIIIISRYFIQTYPYILLLYIYSYTEKGKKKEEEEDNYIITYKQTKSNKK